MASSRATSMRIPSVIPSFPPTISPCLRTKLQPRAWAAHGQGLCPCGAPSRGHSGVPVKGMGMLGFAQHGHALPSMGMPSRNAPPPCARIPATPHRGRRHGNGHGPHPPQLLRPTHCPRRCRPVCPRWRACDGPGCRLWRTGHRPPRHPHRMTWACSWPMGFLARHCRKTLWACAWAGHGPGQLSQWAAGPSPASARTGRPGQRRGTPTACPGMGQTSAWSGPPCTWPCRPVSVFGDARLMCPPHPLHDVHTWLSMCVRSSMGIRANMCFQTGLCFGPARTFWPSRVPAPITQDAAVGRPWAMVHVSPVRLLG